MKDFIIDDFWYVEELKMIVDPNESSFPMMPETVDTSTAIAGTDGEVDLGTTYGPRNFEIVGYSKEGLNYIEKVKFKEKLAHFLHEYKNTPFRLVIKPWQKSYDVKYNGAIENENYPQSIKVTIPLKSYNSFAYRNTENILMGNWTKESNTIEPTGVKITIYGPATNPKVTLNGIEIEVSKLENGVEDFQLEDNEKLIINTKNCTITKVDKDNIESNALKYFKGNDFPKVQEGKNVFEIDESTITNADNVVTQWNDLTF